MVQNVELPTTDVYKQVDPFVDLGNLLLIDRDSHCIVENRGCRPEEDLKTLARDNVQFLFNELFKLPRTFVCDATCAVLPDKTYGIPREKPVPTKPALTRWKAFAERKGIVSKNKDTKVWHEETKTWKPRYGYRSGKNDKDQNWLIEIPNQKDPYTDYFGERDESRKEQIAKNELQRLKNVKKAMKEGEKGKEMPTYRQQNNAARGSNKIPLGVGHDPKHRTKKELGFKIHHAKEATASAGKYQRTLKGEKTPKLGIKRKFEANEVNTKSERSKQLEILTKLESKKPKIDLTRVSAAAEALQQKSYAHHYCEDNNGEQKRAKTPKKVKGTGRKACFKASKGTFGGAKHGAKAGPKKTFKGKKPIKKP